MRLKPAGRFGLTIVATLAAGLLVSAASTYDGSNDFENLVSLLALAVAGGAVGCWLSFLRHDLIPPRGAPSEGTPVEASESDERRLRPAKAVALVGAALLTALLVGGTLSGLFTHPTNQYEYGDCCSTQTYYFIIGFELGGAILAVGVTMLAFQWLARAGRGGRGVRIWGLWTKLLIFDMVLLTVGYAIEEPDQVAALVFALAVAWITVVLLRPPRLHQKSQR